MDFTEYKSIANNVQLSEVFLEWLECKKLNGSDKKLNLSLERGIKEIDSHCVNIFLKATVSFNSEGPCSISVIYRGLCKSNGNVSEDELNKYAYVHVVPLLLPYIRECVSSTMSRMGLAPYWIPTMDVLKSLEENDSDNSIN